MGLLQQPALLAGAGDADAGTGRGQGAGGAAGREGLADVLAEGDEEVVVPDPVATGEPPRSAASLSAGVRVWISPQRLEMRCTCTSTQIPGLPKPTVTTRFAVFRPTPLRVRRSSIRSGTRPPYRSRRSRQMPSDHARLRAIEPHREDGALDPAGGQPRHGLGPVGEREEAGRRGPRGLVLGPEREDAGDEDVEGIAPLGRDLRQRGGPPLGLHAAQARDEAADGQRGSAGPSPRVIGRGRARRAARAPRASP